MPHHKNWASMNDPSLQMPQSCGTLCLSSNTGWRPAFFSKSVQYIMKFGQLWCTIFSDLYFFSLIFGFVLLLILIASVNSIVSVLHMKPPRICGKGVEEKSYNDRTFSPGQLRLVKWVQVLDIYLHGFCIPDICVPINVYIRCTF